MMKNEVCMDLLKGVTSDGEIPRAKLAIEMTPEEHEVIECKSNYAPMIFVALEDLIRSLRLQFNKQDKSGLFDAMMEQLLDNLMDDTMKDEDFFDGSKI